MDLVNNGQRVVEANMVTEEGQQEDIDRHHTKVKGEATKHIPIESGTVRQLSQGSSEDVLNRDANPKDNPQVGERLHL